MSIFVKNAIIAIANGMPRLPWKLRQCYVDPPGSTPAHAEIAGFVLRFAGRASPARARRRDQIQSTKP